MHFITGYSFSVTGEIQSQQATRIISSVKSVVKNKVIDGFKVGETYQINHIKPGKEKVIYTFRGAEGLFEKEFKSINDAEQLISRLSGAIIPNYKKFYEARKD